jgi:hypothetical protein
MHVSLAGIGDDPDIGILDAVTGTTVWQYDGRWD